jgi:ABC-type glycerol-3-phosphate transport system substrate-binding protein
MYKSALVSVKLKKSKFTRSLITFIVFLLCAFMIIIVSCRMLDDGVENGATREDSGGASEGEGDDTKNGEKLDVAITLWDCLDPKGRLALMDTIDDFTVENSHVEIETEHFRSQEELEDRFEAASLAGAGPEIILLDFDGLQRLVPGNVVKEITGETVSGIDYSLFLDGLVEISEYSGRNYIVPFRSYDFMVFYYNKDIVEEPPYEFEEVIEYCKEVNIPGENVYGFLLNSNDADWIIPFIGGYGDWAVDYGYGSLTLDNEATVKTMEFLNYIYNEEKILPSNIEYEEINGLFKSGSAHMIIDNISQLGEYEGSDIRVGVAKIPRVWQGSRNPTPLISGLGFMINVNCYGNELEAAGSLIGYMLDDEVQAEWTSRTDTFPALISMDGNDIFAGDELKYEAFQQAKICRGRPYEKIIMAIRNALRDNAMGVISQDILPADAAVKIQEDALRLRSGSISVEEEAETGETNENQ